ncbi:hypothetical protein GOV09_06995 [Candidatus Woesearchaeota archaeon]|nr:hypothetical protein [Candidatus Woesearchaeota archaeon]
MDEVYEAREDSHLLEKYVMEFAHGICLDMGTGSGIQAMAASKKADFVIATDVNQKALEHCNSVMTSNKIFCLKSDLFSFFEKKFVVIRDKKFKGFADRKDEGNKFDVIIFNPPYLPTDERDPDVALDGGKHGYEIIERFLRQAGEYLADKGVILLIFSSIAGKEKIDSIIVENGFRFEALGKRHISFEDMHCYKISK